jgi:hypothetical protein
VPPLVVSSISAAPVVGLMALGVMIALVGHVIRSRGTVACGLAILFLATAGMMAGGFAAFHGGDTDPRPGCPNDDCRSAPDTPQRDRTR